MTAENQESGIRRPTVDPQYLGASYTVKQGDRLWRFIRIVADTHIDDLTDDRLQQIEDLILRWRITHADGGRL